ncbi:hypothetical protein WJX73_010170 [Symbiochloris irregularis]|uniref:CRAL-TRIO domain-containing protein n=1 Tax=Symbiochloris irregularis TaxID=706552 RepID=A0AAW1PW88_9CHLO
MVQCQKEDDTAFGTPAELSQPWWNEPLCRLKGAPVNLKISCSTPLGDLWVTIPLRRGRPKRKPRQAPAVSLPAGNEVPEDSIRRPLEEHKVFLQGCDTHGRPVILVLGQRHFTATRDLTETLQLIIYALDNTVALSDLTLNPDQQIICLFDLGGVRMRNVDVAALRMVFDLVQNHYPEHLAAMWFLNAPFVFRTAWRGISPFIQPSTREKIAFLEGERGRETLQTNISGKVLPMAYGGDAELVPIQDAVAIQRRMSSKLASKQRSSKGSHKAKDVAKARGVSMARVAKRWAGVTGRFFKRHNPGPPVATAFKSWFGAKQAGGKPGRIRTSISHISRAMSERLSIATPRGLRSPREGAQGMVRGLSKVTPVAVAALVLTMICSLSQGAVQLARDVPQLLAGIRLPDAANFGGQGNEM